MANKKDSRGGLELSESDLFDRDGFEWPVCEQGYHWVQSKHGRLLTPIDGTQGKYKPLRSVAIHRGFAETELTESGIADFAKRFGLLDSQFAKDSESFGVDAPRHGINAWTGEILFIKTVLQLWDLIDSGNVDQLRREVKWVDGRTEGWRFRDFKP